MTSSIIRKNIKRADDKLLSSVAGGARTEYGWERGNEKYYYNVGDVVEVYTTPKIYLTTVRGVIVERRWSDFETCGEYKIEYLEDHWYSFFLPDWVNALRIESLVSR